MIESYYNQIRKKENLRENLIDLRAALKQESKLEHGVRPEWDNQIFIDLLLNEDPKVRKNAALILGELEVKEALEPLFTAYMGEETLYIRADYLEAISKLDYLPVFPQLKLNYEELLQANVLEEAKKHYYEEMQILQKMIFEREPRQKPKFTELSKPVQVLVTTNRNHRELTAAQMPEGKKLLSGNGIKMETDQLRDLMKLRTMEEVLVILPGCSNLKDTPREIAEGIIDSEIVSFLEGCHNQKAPFYFRVGIYGQFTLQERSNLSKRIAMELEMMSDQMLRNSPGDYDFELRCIPKKEGGYQVFLKLFTLADHRFTYRKEFVATSLKPQSAALLVKLAEPFLKKDGQILDPFCGVGTLLLERMKCVSAKEVYGLDIYGEAIEKAKINSVDIGANIHYINRDYYDFKHDYLFDEIITEFPARGKMSRDEMDELYEMFFNKSKEHLHNGGILVISSNEVGFIKKYLRLNKEYRLLKEFLIDQKQDIHEYILKYQVENDEKTGR